MGKGTNIRIDGVKPSYYTQVPNMAFRALSPNAYKLLAVYIDIAKDVDVYASNATVSERLNTSVNTMKKARQELADCGYIKYTAGNEHDTADVVICWNWIWSENYKVMHKVSNSDTPLSNSDTPLSDIDTNQELYNKELYKEKTTTDVVVGDLGWVIQKVALMMGVTADDIEWVKSVYEDYPAKEWHDVVMIALERSQSTSIGSVRKYIEGIFKKRAIQNELDSKVSNKPQVNYSTDGNIKRNTLKEMSS